jgi:hypothetical protein
LGKVVERGIGAFIRGGIALGIDDAQNKMTGIMAVWVERAPLMAVSFSEVSCERPSVMPFTSFLLER